LAHAEFENYPIFNIVITKNVSNVPSEVLNPSTAWTGTKETYVATVEKLAGLFNENFQLYADQATPEIVNAGPRL
ncbi:Protein kinase C-like 1, partial [Basidiobolus ranarum]